MDDPRGSTVDIVIVNWNAGALLAQCLHAVAKADVARVEQVIVVDNGSTDGSADIAVDGLPLRIVKAEQNLGFGKACNRGAALGRADHILFLNPDTEVEPDAIDRAARRLDEDVQARTGVVGIRLVDRTGQAQRHCARFPTWTTFVGHSLGLDRAMPRLFPPMIMTDFDHLTSRPVDHVMGAFYLIRRALFERLGGFDERYFVYLEDIDLSRRVRAAGREIVYLAEPAAYHRQGGTSEQIKARRLFYSLDSVITYAAKHFGAPGAVTVAAAVYGVEPFVRSLAAIGRRSPRDLGATWRGFAMLYGNTPAMMRKMVRSGRSAAATNGINCDD